MSPNKIHSLISKHIASSMEHLGGIPETLPDKIEQAANTIANQFIHDNKLMVLGSPGIRYLGDLFCHKLVFQSPDQQPALPAMVIQQDSNSAWTVKANQKSLLRSVEALGNNGDMLFILCDFQAPALCDLLTELYHARGIKSVYLGPQNSSLAEIDHSHTIYMPLDCTDITRTHEMSLFILNCLGVMIQATVFGNQ